jgi:hypothetical protein
VAQLLPWEARPCDWVADPGRLASVLGWGTSGETILGAQESWSLVKLRGSSSERIQIVFGIPPLSAGGDRTMLTTFLVDVSINR